MAELVRQEGRLEGRRRRDQHRLAAHVREGGRRNRRAGREGDVEGEDGAAARPVLEREMAAHQVDDAA